MFYTIIAATENIIDARKDALGRLTAEAFLSQNTDGDDRFSMKVQSVAETFAAKLEEQIADGRFDAEDGKELAAARGALESVICVMDNIADGIAPEFDEYANDLNKALAWVRSISVEV